MRRLHKLLAISCVTLVGFLLASVALPAQQVTVGLAAPGTAPILLVTNSANTADPYGAYLGEILRAEGLNEFDTLDISAVTASDLSGHLVTVLAQTSLTSAQAQLF